MLSNGASRKSLQSSSSIAGDSMTAAAKAAFQKQLTEIDSLDDPLAVYDAYITHLLNTSAMFTPSTTNVNGTDGTKNTLPPPPVPSSSSFAVGEELLQVLTQCTQAFDRDERYAQDPRWCRHWIAYAERVKDAEPVFAYMQQRGVGTKQALFWESWARSTAATTGKRY